MPYILQKDRDNYDAYIGELVEALGHADDESADMGVDGHLNYIITRLLIRWLEMTDESYADMNALIGVLESAKQEFYRRVVAPYEDRKAQINGDVY